MLTDWYTYMGVKQSEAGLEAGSKLPQAGEMLENGRIIRYMAQLGKASAIYGGGRVFCIISFFCG